MIDLPRCPACSAPLRNVGVRRGAEDRDTGLDDADQEVTFDCGSRAIRALKAKKNTGHMFMVLDENNIWVWYAGCPESMSKL